MSAATGGGTTEATAPLSGGRRVAALLVPWAFMAFFAFMYGRFLWPQLTSLHIIPTCFALFVGLVFISFTVAAITFSRDVLAGRYP